MNTVDNNNLMIMILRFSALDLTEIIENVYFDEAKFPDLDYIQEVISKSETNAKIKVNRLSPIIDSIFTEVYYK